MGRVLFSGDGKGKIGERGSCGGTRETGREGNWKGGKERLKEGNRRVGGRWSDIIWSIWFTPGMLTNEYQVRSIGSTEKKERKIGSSNSQVNSEVGWDLCLNVGSISI